MRNHNNGLEKNHIFSRIKAWWYNIFHKSKKVEEKLNNNQNTTVSINNQLEVNDIFKEYRKKNEREQYLMQLQSKFENNMILESDISENDKTDLQALYLEQISNLKRKIRTIEIKIQKLN